MNTEERAMMAQRIEMDPVETYRLCLGYQADELAKLPDHMQPGAARYVLIGIKPGSFLCAAFAGEWEIAKHKADALNALAMPDYHHFMTWGCPADCHGSSDKVRAWCESGGLLGREVVA